MTIFVVQERKENFMGLLVGLGSVFVAVAFLSLLLKFVGALGAGAFGYAVGILVFLLLVTILD